MRNRLLLIILPVFCIFCTDSLASTVPSGGLSHPVYPNVKVYQFVELSVKEIEKLSGEKMSLPAKLSFLLLKKKMKRALKKDPQITVTDFMNSQKKMKTWLLVLLIVAGAILIAFIIFALAYSGSI
jgi:hypothetical protein